MHHIIVIVIIMVVMYQLASRDSGALTVDRMVVCCADDVDRFGRLKRSLQKFITFEVPRVLSCC